MPSIESKSVSVSERGLTSVLWMEYSEHEKRGQSIHSHHLVCSKNL